jgi:hypothetical protein
MTQDEHERWNARNYPGTRQLCCACDQPTGRCEEDAIYIEPIVPNGSSYGPFCVECYEERNPAPKEVKRRAIEQGLL